MTTGRRAVVLDLKAIREDPERRPSGAGAPRRRRRPRRGAEARRQPPRAAARDRGRPGARRTRPTTRSPRPSARVGTPTTAIAEMREVAARIKELEAELPRSRRTRDRLAARLPNLPDPDAPEGDTDEDAVHPARGRRAPEFGFEPRDHLELGSDLGLIEMEEARACLRLALRLPARRSGAARAGAGPLRDRAGSRARATPVVPPVLVREEALYGTGFFPGERETDLRGRRGRALPGRDLRGARSPACTPTQILEPTSCRSATRASRPAFAARRVPRASDTRGIFRVHQFDKVEMFSFVEPRSPRTSTSGCWRSRSGSSPSSRFPIASSTSRSATSARRRAQVRLRGLDSEPAALPRAHFVLEHDRLPGPQRSASAFGCRGRGAAARAHAQRHRGRRRPHPDRADREPPGREAMHSAPEVRHTYGAPKRVEMST